MSNQSILSTTFSYLWPRSLKLNQTSVAPLAKARWKIRHPRTFDAELEYIPLKSDWLTNKNEHSGHAQKLETGHRSGFLVLAKGIAASGTGVISTAGQSAGRVATAGLFINMIETSLNFATFKVISCIVLSRCMLGSFFDCICLLGQKIFY